MSSYSAINNYNTYLVENQLNINIIDYVKEINKLNITKKKIDISFIDEFIELVSKEIKLSFYYFIDCCIHHDILQKYGISSLKSGTNDIKNC
jgi:hypothetical protein